MADNRWALTRWSCEFVDKSAERCFLHGQYPSIHRQANFLFIAVGVVALVLVVVDLLSLSEPAQQARHLVSRGLVVLSAVAAAMANRRWRTPAAVDAIAALFTLAPMTMVLASALLRPGVNFQAPAVTIAVIMGTFMFVPTRLLHQCLIAGYSLGGGILIWGVVRTGDMAPAIITRFVITCVLAYLLGFYASRRLAASQRRQFAALQVSEENYRRLLAEIEERRRVEGELRQAKERAEEAMRAKADFLAVMSHEIRTPMNAILGVARLMAEGEGPPAVRHHAGMIVGAGRTLMTLLKDLLDLSRLDGGRLTLVKEPFDLPALVAGAVELMRPAADKRGLGLSCAIDPLLPQWVEGDPDRLRQVLFNYLSNALKFTERGGISVDARLLAGTDDGLELRLSVSDNGIGIDPERKDQLFEPFTQGHEGLGRRHGGAGLGLAIAKQIAGLMGGTVGVESTLGAGACFWMTARLRKAAPVPAAPVAAPAARPLSVLMVEDQELNSFVLGQMLSLLGHRVVAAADRAAAAAALAAQEFDLVLTDLELGGDSGLDVIRDVRLRTACQRHVPIVAVTAHVVERYRLLAEEAGVDGYLAKPITLEALAAELARLDLAGGEARPAIASDAGGLEGLYAAAIDREWQRIAAAVDASDMPTLGGAAHALAGAAGVVGDGDVSELCCVIEEACESGSPATLGQLVALLRRCLESRRTEPKHEKTRGEAKGMRHLKLLIGDDHEVVRCGLRLLLGQMPNGEVVGEAADGLAVLDLARRLAPDIVVLDLSMPKMAGLDVIAALKKEQPRIGVVVLTVTRGSAAVTEALAAGADAYVLKDQTGKELIDAIDMVAGGKIFVSRRLRQAVRAAVPAPATPSALTPRERQVLKLLADGHSNQAVANILKIGSATVEKHRANLRRKLGVDSAVGLALAAIREGLVEAEPTP